MTRHAQAVAVSRRIPASAATIFAAVSDPRRHSDLDGSGMLRGTDRSEPVSAVGDVFVMKMHYGPIGDYEMNNHIVRFEHDRAIAWQPVCGRGHPDAGTPEARWGQTWTFELQPEGPDATIVTETWDCHDAAEDEGGEHWVPAMAATLARLERACAGAAP